jgi:undecaprenyl phosphate-alpha-L-ara4N flippase subunit ArnE
MTDAAASPPRPRPAVLSFFLNPYVQILIGSLLDTAGEVLLKKGASGAPHVGGLIQTLGLPPLLVGWTWVGIVSYVLSLFSWLYVLRSVPLSVAFPLINVVHVLVPLGSMIFLHEHVSDRRWMGIGLIVCGVLLIVRPLVKAEEKL